MPAKKPVIKKVAAAKKVTKKPVAKRTQSRRPVSKSLFDQNPNLQLLLAILGLIAVFYLLAYLMMPLR